MGRKGVSTREQIAAEIRASAPCITAAALDTLIDMYTASTLRGTESETPVMIDRTTRVSVAQGAALNQAMRSISATNSVEVGLAYGFSTVWLLDALAAHPGARHVSIDPAQKTAWYGIGLHQAARAAGVTRHEWLEAQSIFGLTDLIHADEPFDFAFIDGNHRFDDVLVDFYLADQIVRPGGIVAFDDMWMPSIRTVTEFVLSNRAYELIDQPVGNLALLKKQRDDDRNWRHFERFVVHRQTRFKLHRKLNAAFQHAMFGRQSK